MALFYGAHVASSDNLDFLERLHCRAARFIFNLPKDMASHGVLERAEWFTIRFYNGRLPSTLTNRIAKKLNLSYSIRARDALLVPRFNTRFMKDSVAYRGTVLWNMLSSRYTDFADTSLCNLVKKLKTSDLFKAALMYYHPRLLVLEMTNLYIIEIKLVFLCLIDIYCKSSFYLHFNY